MARTKTLTPKQQQFVREYLIDLNGAAAYRRAGYASKNPDVDAAKLLVKPSISAAIQRAQFARARRTEITADLVLRELAKLGLANMLDYLQITPDGLCRVDLSQVSHEQFAAIQELTVEESTEGAVDNSYRVRRVKLKLADKKGPLELLGKHLGLFTRVEITGANGGPITVRNLTIEELMQLDDAELARMQSAAIAAHPAALSEP